MKQAFLFIAFFLVLFPSVSLIAQSVNPDWNYGSAGLVKTDFNYYKLATAQTMHVDSNGITRMFGSALSPTIFNKRKSAAAGLLANGDMDSSFGKKGKQIYLYKNDTNFSSEIYKSFQLDNGDFLLGGYAVEDGGKINAMLIKINANGQLDSAWGKDGFCVADLGASDYVYGIVPFPDGSIVAICQMKRTVGIDSSALLKILPNGKVDLSFGWKGHKTIPLAYSLQINDAFIADSTHLIAAGYYFNAKNIPVLLKMGKSGILDSTFATNGFVGFQNTIGSINDIAMDDSGRILGAGYTEFAGNIDFVAYRFMSDGNPDFGFGPNGRKDIRISDDEDLAVAIFIAKDKNIYLLGKSATPSGPYQTVIVKISGEGLFDNKFGSFGAWKYDFTNRDDDPKSLGMDKYGRMYLGGTFNVYSSLSYFMTMRLAFTWPAAWADHAKANSLIVYPNPTGSSFYINPSGSGKKNSMAHIALTNIKGQLLFEKDIPNDILSQIQLSSCIVPGIYNLCVSVDGKSQNLKLSVR